VWFQETNHIPPTNPTDDITIEHAIGHVQLILKSPFKGSSIKCMYVRCFRFDPPPLSIIQKIQLSFILSLKEVGLWTPPPIPSEFPITTHGVGYGYFLEWYILVTGHF